MADSEIEDTGTYNASPDPDDYTVGQTPSGATYHTKFSDIGGGGAWIYGDGSDGPLVVAAARTVSDGVTTNKSNIVTSATASFTGADVGQALSNVTGSGTLQGARIVSVQSSTQARLSIVASDDAAADTFVIGGKLVPGFYTDVTIPGGITARWEPTAISAATVQAIFCTGTFDIEGTLDLSGDDAIDRLATGSYGANAPMQAGAAGGVEAGEPRGLASGVQAGNGGDGSNGVGTAVALAIPPFVGRNIFTLLTGNQSYIWSGGGGGAGGGDGVNYGGAGGGGGYFALIVAKHVVHGVANLYNLQGGNGAPGGDDGAGATGNGDCGGGGGGGGGWWVTVSDTIDDIPVNIVGTGGTGGAGCGTGTDGSPGEDGFGMHLLN